VHLSQIRAVYAANAPVTITKSDVSALFGRFGQIESIFLSAELPKKAPRPIGRRSGQDGVLTWHTLVGAMVVVVVGECSSSAATGWW
jgi:hypothetical protein